MPLHDWSRVPAGLFHDFHQSWTVQICDALNACSLPKGNSALIERSLVTHYGDGSRAEFLTKSNASCSDNAFYAGRANRIVLRHHLSQILAVIEIVSPGNKDSRAALRNFVDKTLDFLKSGIHVLVVDLFPPTQRDPFGIHKLIWDEIEEEPFVLPPGKDRILVAYETGRERAAYIEPVGVGDVLPDMPVFLSNDLHVLAPLESTYMATWNASPEEFRVAIETGVMPQPDED